eukprot:58909_1
MRINGNDNINDNDSGCISLFGQSDVTRGAPPFSMATRQSFAPQIVTCALCRNLWRLDLFISKHYPKQLLEYVISDTRFIDYGTDWNAYDVYGWGQFWTQIDHLIYMKDYATNSLHIFNMQTKQFTYQFITHLPTNGSNRACVASSATHLFVLGGVRSDDYKDLIATVDAYHLATKQWLTNVPDMQRNKSDLSCIVHPNVHKLYVIAGHSIIDGQYHSEDTVEAIEINDITSKSWGYIEPISITLAWVRSVVHQNTIYVIGGARGDPDYQKADAYPYVHAINVLTNEVSLFSEELQEGLSNLASVVVSHRIYTFGGWAGTEEAVSTWMTYDAPVDPTLSPTQDPTMNATKRATPNPTKRSTPHPSKIPTVNPTKNPTINPTKRIINPTKYPGNPTKK